MDVSIFAAFLAGLVSFLSPCVLPLVPGYISMLSGIGVEQLKEGKTPRAGLLASALAFVTGFSVVFISFGASASAVGSFLLRNRASLAPIAGALAGQIPATTGFDQVLIQWRYESVSATLRFLDARLATVPAPRAG